MSFYGPGTTFLSNRHSTNPVRTIWNGFQSGPNLQSLSLLHNVYQGWATLVLEGYCPTEFSSFKQTSVRSKSTLLRPSLKQSSLNLRHLVMSCYLNFIFTYFIFHVQNVRVYNFSNTPTYNFQSSMLKMQIRFLRCVLLGIELKSARQWPYRAWVLDTI